MCRPWIPLFVLSFFAGLMPAAARTGSISGYVFDESGKPLSYASVILLNWADSAVLKTELTGDKGDYTLTPLAGGTYEVRVVMAGYKTGRTGKVEVKDDAVALPPLRLIPEASALSGVTITAQKPFIEVQPGKLVVNVENSIVSAGSSVMDVLQRSPGVNVDQGDHISLKGKQGVNIMIDGRTVPVSSSDLANMLRSMPSENVEKIEIMTNPPAQYDAAGTAGIINIRTHKDKKSGLNGTVNGSIGQGVYPKDGGGFTLNYRQNKLNIYGSYNASFRTGFSQVDWDRRFYTSDTFTGAYVQDNYSVLTFHTHMVNVGADYDLDKRNSAGFSLSGENFYLGTRGYYAANVFDTRETVDSLFATHNTSSGNWNNYAPNVHFRHQFDTGGKVLTADADYARYTNRNNQDFTTLYTLPGGAESRPDYMLHADISGLTEIRSLKADYVNPVGSKTSFAAGVKVSDVQADNQPIFFDRSQGTNRFDSGKSDHFLYSERIIAGYVNGSRSTDAWNMQAGVRAEQTGVRGHELITGQEFTKSYMQLFPNLGLQYHLDKNNDLGISLSRRIERPGYEDLNPYKFFVDPSTYKEGDPYLDPALTYAAELTHVYKQRLITTLSYSVTNHVITEVIKPDTGNNRVTIQTKDNLYAMHYAGLSGAYTIPLYSWWTNITTFDAYYAEYEGNLSNTNLKAGKPTFDFNTTNKITLPHDLSFELTVFYQAAQLYGFLNLTAISMFNIGVQKSWLEKKLTVKLSATDLFLHGNESGSSYFVSYRENFTAVHDTRQAALAVFYHFGRKSVSPAGRHSGGAEEEKKRASERGA